MKDKNDLRKIGMLLHQGLGSGPEIATVPLKYDEILVASVQMDPKPIDPANPAKAIKENVDQMLYLCDLTEIWTPKPNGVQLIVFPEFSINGMDTGWSRKQLQEICISIPGPETEALGAKAKELDCYITFANYCQDPDWPGHIFNMSVIIGPDGDVIHKHIKAYQGIPGQLEWATTVHDILDEYVERNGWDAVWPVARTPIGNIGTYTCSEGFFPETARALTMNGAEILVRHTANCPGAPFNGEYPNLGNPALAFQADCGANHTFGIYANSSGTSIVIAGIPFTGNVQSGTSMILDEYGYIKTQTQDSRQQVIRATLPIASLRKRHQLPMIRKELYAPMYENCYSPVPPNMYSEYLPTDHIDALEWSLKNKN